MREIFNAELTVETHRSIRLYPFADISLQLSDFNDYTEFYAACEALYKEEENPVIIHRFWENIPDNLITKRGLKPVFFDIRNALERLDEDDIDGFLLWCEYNGHDLLADDPLLLVTRYEDIIAPRYDYSRENHDFDDDSHFYDGAAYAVFAVGTCAEEIFDENYN